MNQNNVAAAPGIISSKEFMSKIQCPLKCSAILSFHVVCHSSRSGSSRTHSGSHHLRSFRRQVLPDRVPAHSQISCDTSGGHSLKLGAMDRLPPRPLSPIGFPAQHVDWMPRSIGPVKGRTRRGELRILYPSIRSHREPVAHRRLSSAGVRDAVEPPVTG